MFSISYSQRFFFFAIMTRLASWRILPRLRMKVKRGFAFGGR